MHIRPSRLSSEHALLSHRSSGKHKRRTFVQPAAFVTLDSDQTYDSASFSFCISHPYPTARPFA